MDIAFNIDDNYVMQCCTTIVSVLHNNPDTPITFHVVGSGLGSASKARLQEVVEGRGQRVCFYDIDEERLSAYSLFDQSGHISMATYYRLFVADILPASIDKLLYMDCDLVVDGSLAPLWNTDVSPYAVAAVEDMWSGKADNYSRLGYDAAYTYFNAGVLLVNLDYWRRHHVARLSSAYVVEHAGKLKFNDQDVLNGLFYDKKLLLPFQWNVQDGLLRKRRKIRAEAVPQLDRDLQQPVIIHFTGHRKPWNFDCISPYRSLFFRYLDMTPWQGTRPVYPLKWRVKTVVDGVLYALRLKPRKYRSIT